VAGTSINSANLENKRKKYVHTKLTFGEAGICIDMGEKRVR
jgi:hypothetical protein